MSKNKTTAVTLQSEGQLRKFDILHAERILKMSAKAKKDQSCWILEDSKYTYNSKDGIKLRTDKGDIKESREAANDK